MLKHAKQLVLHASKRVGLQAATRDSRWRARRLLVLCYHGISVEDEHEWNPVLYMPPATFRRRLETLRNGGYAVLPLDDATVVHPGHGPSTTVGRERATNPFLDAVIRKESLS